ncbi:MFS transporter [Oceanicella sp. SM1341]|uniref:MFS transporter n=1 Tax=Oceanicella sp. SM1341 TaxID=1548889 RepID=UPI000E527A6A|nr:MFS transporter [Oceanicella sp. SM1341]
MRLLVSFAALFLSISLVQLGSGALAPLDVLSGIQQGFSDVEIGLLGTAHFVGFFVGCWLAPRMMGSVGHIRAFAAFAAAGAIGALAHPMLISPLAWAAMRVMTGFAVAGAYTVTEAWLQAKITNDMRGKVMSVYRLVDLGASLVAQMMIAVLEPASYISYNLLAILCCLCLVPLTLTASTQPATPKAPRLRPLRTIALSPLGAAGVIVAGITTPAFRMVGPIYGNGIGLGPGAVGWFLGAAVLGGAAAQVPVGMLADRFDRRYVLIALSAGAVAVSAWLAGAGSSPAAVLAGSFAFGFTAFCVYSISAAHANDFAEPEFMTELNASLMFLYGLGAIASPLAASALMSAFGPPALFAYISLAHAGLILFGLYRMTRRPTVEERTTYRYTPRTSYMLSRLLRRRRG